PIFPFFQLRREQSGLEAAAPQEIEAAVARHAEEPAVEGERRVVPLDHLGQTREDVAPRVLGRLRGAEEMAAETQHARAERLVELGQALPVAAPGALHGPGHLGRAHGPSTSITDTPPSELQPAPRGPAPPPDKSSRPLPVTGAGPHPYHTTEVPICSVTALRIPRLPTRPALEMTTPGSSRGHPASRTCSWGSG